MDSVGSFQLKEVDGERSFVYVPAIYSNEPAIDSGESEGHLSQTRFFCREGRAEAKRLEIGVSSGAVVRLDSSPHFHGVAPQIKSDDDYERLDRLNRHVVLPLFWCNNKPEHCSEGICGACFQYTEVGDDFYFCGECDRMYHKECIESPPQINHPLHPKHPLQLWDEEGFGNCFDCEQVSAHLAYHCTLCKFNMHPVCAVQPIPYVIDTCKRHNHPLTFFTRRASLDCNVCGLTSDVLPTYVCLECNFVAHEDCVDSPHVIRISRHKHRISFVLPLPSGNQYCGVCRKEVNREYGGYTCTKKCDDYVVHSRCALRMDIWDGEELVEEDEVEEVVEPPFERISEGIIRHFTHIKHLLRIETSRVYDESKICEACVIPIYEGDFYSCGECDFILHHTCANAPRKKIHPLHPHPLTLTLFDGNHDGFYYRGCGACHGRRSGFNYECIRKECTFMLDVRCASISEPFNYQGHKQPLFLALEGSQRCPVCQVCRKDLLNCIKCDYIICFKCVTIPYMARYKHDKHFLTLGYGDETSKPDWCEVCEKILPPGSRDKRFYTCNYCCTTLHTECLLGKDRYMKPGHTVTNGRNSVGKILLNNSLSRPTCDKCKSRCEDKIIYRRENKTWCSYQQFYYFST